MLLVAVEAKATVAADASASDTRDTTIFMVFDCDFQLILMIYRTRILLDLAWSRFDIKKKFER